MNTLDFRLGHHQLPNVLAITAQIGEHWRLFWTLVAFNDHSLWVSLEDS